MLTEELINEYRPDEGSKVLFVTGRLAATGLKRVMEAINPTDFQYEIRVLDVEIAAWLDVSTIQKQIGDIDGFNVLVIPGKTTGDDEDLTKMLGIEVVRGPNCYSELPVFLEEIGFEPDSSEKVVPPKILVLDDKHGIAEYLAKTYEVKLIDPRSSGEERHNQLAEIVRSETIGINGWVIKNYPGTGRDIEWLKDMKLKPDAIVATEDSEIVSYYADKPQLLMIEGSDSEEIRKSALIEVETLMQTCINPDEGLGS